jgi:assimilatory nitrate reductase catalytic subunit
VALLHPLTAERHGIGDGDTMVVSGPRGEMHIVTSFSAEVHPDSVSMPHGWSQTNVCDLTSAHEVDALTGMVVQTAIPVDIRRAAL